MQTTDKTLTCMQVDLIDFSGPEFSAMDNRLAALRLVQRGLCDAALFDSQGMALASLPEDT